MEKFATLGSSLMVLMMFLMINVCNCYTGSTNYGTNYNTGYGNNYNTGYKSNYNTGYKSNYNTGYGNSYNNGYSNNYNSGYGTSYGTNYNNGYGTNYNKGYGPSYKSYGSGYGSSYAKNFYQTFPYFFLNPFNVGYFGSGFQSPIFGSPWSPFGSFPWSFGNSFGYHPYGGYNSNLYGIHPQFRYNGHYGVYQNYGYGQKYPGYFNGYGGGYGHSSNHMILPVPVPIAEHHPFNSYLHRRPTLGERIFNSPLLPAALIAAPLLLLAKGK